jgi:DNA polymerase-4
MPALLCHVDMNSYFASVEQQANPFLRGKAVGVCAYLHARGCVIAASVEAKQQGMKVGMTVAQAKEIVPGAVFVENDPSKYRAVTGRLFRLLDGLTDKVEHYSIDEAFLDLTGWYRDSAEAAFALSRIKHRLKTEIGDWLRCSVGIAPTRFFAKFASNRQKPNGLVIITSENVDEMLATAELQDAWGIGPRTQARLKRLGIQNLLALKRYPVGNLLSVFGRQGFYLWCKVNGIECDSLADSERFPKSIGHSYCVPGHVNRDRKVAAVFAKLTERAGRRLRRHGLLAGALVVIVGCKEERTSRHRFFRFSEPSDDSFALTLAADRVLHEVWRGETVDFLAVTLVDLGIPRHQLRFGWQEGRRPYQERLAMVSKSLDRIRDRYGESSVVLGRMFQLLSRDEAPDRIGFRKIGVLEPD